MFASSFDLIVEEAQARHPRSLPAAYADIAKTLARFGFERFQNRLVVQSHRLR
jgi:virulence-associated protein VapD